MKKIDRESYPYNRRLRRELEDRDRVLQALLAHHGYVVKPFLIPKAEYLAPPLKVWRGSDERYVQIGLAPNRDGYQGLGEFPEWARGLFPS